MIRVVRVPPDVKMRSLAAQDTVVEVACGDGSVAAEIGSAVGVGVCVVLSSVEPIGVGTPLTPDNKTDVDGPAVVIWFKNVEAAWVWGGWLTVIRRRLAALNQTSEQCHLDRARRRFETIGMTQVELAAKLGVGRSAVCQWLSGKSAPSLTRAAQIEWLTGIPASEWVTDAVDNWLNTSAD